MSNVIASLEKVLLPFAVKIGKQPHVNAIKNGFIRLMPLTLAGAMNTEEPEQWNKDHIGPAHHATQRCQWG